MKHRVWLLLCFLLVSVPARSAGRPVVGAQVFIEPGQTVQQIDRWFSILEEAGFEYARIRMFGAHLEDAEGNWDFSLYDEAFRAAERHHVRLFATLFPTTDELSDVGGFKFPKDRKQLAHVADYIDRVVTHFRSFPALDSWVLQNEPGLGALKAPVTPLSSEKRAEWEASRPARVRNGFLEADFSDQEFLVHYTTWYLGWIAERVRALDPDHGRHINPHQILSTLPEYDFDRYRDFLTSLGSSMHFSWHFGMFRRQDYPLGVSLMTDLIASNAQGMPYWITEFQGGPVTASGYQVLCPTPEEVTQSLWTGIGAGIDGFLFWTLNARRAVMEAGEWSLLDFQGEPSERMRAASEVIRTVREHETLFSDATPWESNVAILYDNESLWVQKFNASRQKDTENEGRGADAVMRSVMSVYKALSSTGVIPQVCRMDAFDWSSPEGKVVILPDQVCLPSAYYPLVRGFVRSGGRIIVTGRTGYYDEHMRCAFMDAWPLEDVFGARLSEFEPVQPYAYLPAWQGIRLQTHLWKGTLKPVSATPFMEEAGRVRACRNVYGKGEAVWIPSLADLGCLYREDAALSAFYAALLGDAADTPVRISGTDGKVLLRTMRSGERVITILVNRSDRRTAFRLSTDLKHPQVIFGAPGATLSPGRVTLGPGETRVCIWND